MFTDSEIKFSIDTLKLFNNDNEPIVFSPMQILNNLAIICVSSKTLCSDQILNVVGREKSKDVITENYGSLMKYYNKLKKENALGHVICKSLFLSDKPFHSSCVEIMQDFDVDYMQLDSDNDCVKEINNFLSENTNNHIDNIIITREDSILKEKYISIVNALYIDSEWDNHFTSIDPILFHIAPFSPYSTRVAQRIYRLIENEEWNFTQGATWKCIGIPYKHRKTWLHILLPNEKSGLNQLINIFDTAMLKQCITKNIPGKMEVMIPVFDIESTICLNQIFIKLGVTNIFEEDNKQKNTCNFHKIFQATKINVNQTGLRQRSPPQCTSEALNEVKKMERKVLNEYDREEWIRMEREEEPVTFFANYPFLYFITLVNESVEDLKSVIAMGKYC